MSQLIENLMNLSDFIDYEYVHQKGRDVVIGNSVYIFQLIVTFMMIALLQASHQT